MTFQGHPRTGAIIQLSLESPRGWCWLQGYSVDPRGKSWWSFIPKAPRSAKTHIRSCHSSAQNAPVPPHFSPNKDKIFTMTHRFSNHHSSYSTSLSVTLLAHATHLVVLITPGMLLPQGFCTRCSLCLECSFPDICLSILLGLCTNVIFSVRPSPCLNLEAHPSKHLLANLPALF